MVLVGAMVKLFDFGRVDRKKRRVTTQENFIVQGR